MFKNTAKLKLDFFLNLRGQAKVLIDSSMHINQYPSILTIKTSKEINDSDIYLRLNK